MTSKNEPEWLVDLKEKLTTHAATLDLLVMATKILKSEDPDGSKFKDFWEKKRAYERGVWSLPSYRKRTPSA